MAEALALTAELGDACEAHGQPSDRLLELRGAAYHVAVRVLASGQGAEDVVQQAYLAALASIRQGTSPDNLRAWFLSVVANTARDHVKLEARLRRRETMAMAMVRGEAERPPPAAGEELVSLLRRGLNELEEKHRLAVALCCEEGLSQREAAAVMEIPQKTLSRYVNRGLDQLRSKLAKAGYTAAPAMVIGGLAHTAPPVPATLAAALEKLVTGGAAVKVAGAAAGATLKGGLIVKIGLGLAAAGLVAGGVLWAVGSKSEEPAKPKAPGAVEGPPEKTASVEKPKSKFATPVTDPGAEWRREPRPYVTHGLRGYLDGPREEACFRIFIPFPRGLDGWESDENVMRVYDPESERYETAAGSATGCLDGPFSRARFGGECYPRRRSSAGTAGAKGGVGSGRYAYFTDPYNGNRLRRLDFEKQEVGTLPLDIAGVGGMILDSNGRLYLVSRKLRVVAPDGKLEKEVPLEIKVGAGFGGYQLALDEVHGRLYAATISKEWYIWYWDLKDGSFHGVLPQPQAGQPKRGHNEPGPFEGTDIYGEGTVAFGPDDPEKRFLYTGRTDTFLCFRLDLEKREIWALSVDEKGVTRFIGQGKPKAPNIYGSPPEWLTAGNGDFDGSGSFLGRGGDWTGIGSSVFLFRRVK